MRVSGSVDGASPKAVSYTHLDVYKRQVQGVAIFELDVQVRQEAAIVLIIRHDNKELVLDALDVGKMCIRDSRQTVLCFTIIFFIVMLFNIRSVTNVKLIDLLLSLIHISPCPLHKR